MNNALKVRNVLLIYLAAVSILTAIALAVVYLRGTILGQQYPFNTLLYNPEVRFFDFTIFEVRFQSFLKHGDFFGPLGYGFGYPAPAAFAFVVFYLFPEVPVVQFLAMMLFAIWFATFLVWLQLRRNTPVSHVATCALLVTAITAYPFYFLLDRGNIEGVIWILLALGVAAFARDKNWLAAFFIGAAASMKPFPGVLLLLLMARRKYREFVFGAFTFVAINLLAMRGLSHSIRESSEKLSAGIGGFTKEWAFAYRPREIGADHSLFSVIKQIFHVKQKYLELNHTLEVLSLPYLILVGGAFLAGHLFFFRKLPILNQLFIFAVASTLLPFVSYDYTLVQIYIPWAAFLIFLTIDVASGRVSLSTSQALRFLIPCAIIFTAQSYLIFAKNISCGGQVKSLVLLALLHAAITVPLPSSVFGELRIASESTD